MADSWSGYLIVTKPGDYTFYLSSSDGSQLYIDGALVVDNGGEMVFQAGIVVGVKGIPWTQMLD